MRRARRVALVVLTATAAARLAARAPQAGDTNLAERTFAAYAAGDVDAIPRALDSSSAALRSDLSRVLPHWKSSWSPRHTAFVLDVAVHAFDHNWPNAATLVHDARTMVVDRPDPPGVRADDDAFEGLVHRIALAVLTRQTLAGEIERYYSAIRNRVAAADAPSSSARRRLVEPRIALERAIGKDLVARSALGGESLTPPPRVVGNKDVVAALTAFETAAEDPATAAEATVRRAYLYARAGDPQRAYDLLGSVHTPDDPFVRYWYGIILGRVLDALGRKDAAADAYEATWKLAPHTQTIAVALAALRLEQGDRGGALEWAKQAHEMADTVVDPWWLYWTGDARSIPSWLAQLRTLATLRPS